MNFDIISKFNKMKNNNNNKINFCYLKRFFKFCKIIRTITLLKLDIKKVESPQKIKINKKEYFFFTDMSTAIF